jgi:hypothetical protein
MRNSTLMIVWLPVLLGAQLMAAGPAGAVEDERFTAVHGTACRVLRREGVLTKFPLMITAGVGNVDPAMLPLECPIPMTSGARSTFLSAKHNVVNSNGTFGDKCNHFDSNSRPWVEVYDRHASADVSCTLLVLGFGNAVQSSFTVASTNMNQGPAVKLFFPMTTFLALTEQNRLYVQCQVPAKSNDFSFVARFGIPTCEGDPP